MGGRACIRGMRIPVSVIVDQIAHGATFDEILADYADAARDGPIEQSAEGFGWALERGAIGVVEESRRTITRMPKSQAYAIRRVALKKGGRKVEGRWGQPASSDFFAASAEKSNRLPPTRHYSGKDLDVCAR